jgi:F-type H+-transporting ATPase subunit gamma
MQTLETLRRRIDNAEDMQSVVSAMKVLAVVSIRQFERSLESLDEYNRTLELGLQAVLQNRPKNLSFQPPAGDKLCALVFGSEQGLSGQFNEEIVSWSRECMAGMDLGLDEAHLIAMGEHVVYRLRAAGSPPDHSFPITGSVAAMRSIIQDIFIYLDELIRSRRADQIILFYHKPLSGASYVPHRRLLFPLDQDYLAELEARVWQSRSLPVFTLDWHELFAALVRQHLFASLERAFAESLLSENASRLFSMQMAEKNIVDYLDDLKHLLNNQRQGEITAELLDIVAGSEALYEDEDALLEMF